MKSLIRRLPMSLIIATLTVLVVAVAVLAGYLYTVEKPGTVTISPIGELVVTPATVDLPDMRRGESHTALITFTNNSETSLALSADSNVYDSSLTYSLLTVASGSFAGAVLTPGMSLADMNVTFTVTADAPFGDWDFIWNVYGETQD